MTSVIRMSFRIPVAFVAPRIRDDRSAGPFSGPILLSTVATPSRSNCPSAVDFTFCNLSYSNAFHIKSDNSPDSLFVCFRTLLAHYSHNNCATLKALQPFNYQQERARFEAPNSERKI